MNPYLNFRTPPTGVLSAASVNRILSGLPDPGWEMVLGAVLDGTIIRCRRVEVEGSALVVEGLLAVIDGRPVQAERLTVEIDDSTDRVYLAVDPGYCDPGSDFDFTVFCPRPSLTGRPDEFATKIEFARLEPTGGRKRAGGQTRRVSPCFWPRVLTVLSDPRSAEVFERICGSLARSGAPPARVALRPTARWTEILPWIALEVERRRGATTVSAAVPIDGSESEVAWALAGLVTEPSSVAMPPTLPGPSGQLLFVDELPATPLVSEVGGDERLAFMVPQGGGQVAFLFAAEDQAATCYVNRLAAGNHSVAANTLSANGRPKLFGQAHGGERVVADVRGGLSGGQLRAGLYRPREGQA